MSLLSCCLYALLRVIPFIYLVHRFVRRIFERLRVSAERRPGRNAVDRAACQMKESCQDLRSYAPPSVFLASRDFIAAFYPHLKCPMLAMDVFTAVLKTLRRSGVLWRPSEKLEACFDTWKLYKCPSNAIRLLAAKKLLKVLKHDLDK